MDFPQYKNLVTRITVGKKLPDSIYTHESAFGSIPEPLTQTVLRIADALKIDDDDWNIIKFYKRDFKLAFLSYPHFETESYPALLHSYTVDLSKLSMRKSEYGNAENPPIIHRKETFVDQEYPLRDLFAEITKEGVEAGLYENPRSIGFRKNWEKLISTKGYRLDINGRLESTADTKDCVNTEPENFEGEVERHKTAINRNQLSQPMQILSRHGYLNGEWSVLDYGCGKGDDLRELEAHGLNISGWDPVHYSEEQLVNSDILNLGFVLNVIEDREERVECLKRAWGYADKLLIVAVMIAGENLISQFRPYKDGILTSRKTFQKYYAQSEFRSFLETTLEDSAVAVGQGIFILFKDKIEEQRFLLERQYVNRNWKQKTHREKGVVESTLKKEIIRKNIELFSDFWEVTLDLGRVPANSEFDYSEQVRRIASSHNKAHKALLGYFGKKLFEEARKKRKEDLLVYFALGLFEKRKPRIHMPESLQRDIKTFFSSYNDALELAREILFSVGNPLVIEKACIDAYEKIGRGELNDGHDFIFHKKYLADLPIELRIYIGCATQLYGDLEEVQLLKAHMTSGKVTLLRYEEWDSDKPKLVERIKIKMRDQDVDFFEYGERYDIQILENKNIF